jgi:thioredoxin reductase (NADPH)
MLDFTDRVTLVAGRPEGFDVPAERLAQLAEEGIAAHPCAVAEYRHAGGQMQALILADAPGTVIPVEHVYTVCRSIPANELARQLGLALHDNGHILVDTTQQTNVPGVYAAGDVTAPHNHQVSAAVHEGNEAAASANYYLYRPVQKAPGDA